MIEKDVLIGHRLGLHARAAARLVQLSRQFNCNIVLTRTDMMSPIEADCRSILGILLLSAAHGTKLSVRADGADEQQAVDEICRYLSE